MNSHPERFPNDPVEDQGRPEALPDGRQALLWGDPGLARQRQVGNALAYLLDLFGAKAPEGELAGQSLVGCVRLLGRHGVPARAERGMSLEDPAALFEEGLAVALLVNAGELWRSPDHYGTGEANLLVVLCGLSRDPDSRVVLGLHVVGPPAAPAVYFVDETTARRAWMGCGANLIVSSDRPPAEKS